MFQTALAPPVSNDPPAPIPCGGEALGPIGRPRRLEEGLLDRILGRCGRVADTTDPSRYGALAVFIAQQTLLNLPRSRPRIVAYPMQSSCGKHAADPRGSAAGLHGFSATDRPGGTVLVIPTRLSARPAVEC